MTNKGDRRLPPSISLSLLCEKFLGSAPHECILKQVCVMILLDELLCHFEHSGESTLVEVMNQAKFKPTVLIENECFTSLDGKMLRKAKGAT